jgi:hypothetical protein
MLPIHRETVARYKVEDRVPVRGGGKKHIAVSYEKFILQRWQEGCHSPKQIFLEMKEKGFEGTISSAYRYLLHLGMKTGQPEQKLQPRRFTASQAAWIITTSDHKLDDHQKNIETCFMICLQRFQKTPLQKGLDKKSRNLI